MKKTVILTCSLLMVLGCAIKTQRVDPDASPEDAWGSTTTSSQDVRTVADMMARDLLRIPQIQSAATPPTIAFLEVKNNTSQIIDKEVYLNSIRTRVLRQGGGKVAFLDRERFDSILAERKLKRGGIVGTSGNKTLLGVDYFLTGVLDSVDKAYKRRRATYTRFAFRLTDAESGLIVWENDYEIKKAGRAGTFDR